MLMWTDPFRELHRLTQQLVNDVGTWTRPRAMPMDAYRAGDELVVHFDLPGVDPSGIELNVDRDTLTVQAERRPVNPDGQAVIVERPYGVFRRQLFLGDSLDTDKVQASYDAGVLTVRIPVAERAKPRKIEISSATAKELTS